MSWGITIIGWVVLVAMVVVLAHLITDDDDVKRRHGHGDRRMSMSDEQLLRITAAVDGNSEPDVEHLRKSVEHLRKSNARLLAIVEEQEKKINEMRDHVVAAVRIDSGEEVHLPQPHPRIVSIVAGNRITMLTQQAEINSLRADVSHWKFQANAARQVCQMFVDEFDRSSSTSIEPTTALIDAARFHMRLLLREQT